MSKVRVITYRTISSFSKKSLSPPSSPVLYKYCTTLDVDKLQVHSDGMRWHNILNTGICPAIDAILNTFSCEAWYSLWEAGLLFPSVIW